ncbi:ctenidin-1 [Musca domestica]|uniref:Ctenidin-1 n=1 Tax=Musca domestica TaxID=7370 RepID=A0A1I8MV99_MUSDO|nr:ctenidin-1 [Musca domestica]
MKLLTVLTGLLVLLIATESAMAFFGMAGRGFGNRRGFGRRGFGGKGFGRRGGGGGFKPSIELNLGGGGGEEESS